VRFLDNVLDATPYPLPQIRAQALLERRIGLGIMGWADALIALGIPYASESALALAERLGMLIHRTAVDASHALAGRRGAFPGFAESIYRDGPERRHANLTTVAPTGTIAIIAGCSSGIEPLFALAFQHRVRHADGERVLTFVNEAVLAALEAEGLGTPVVRERLLAEGRLGGIAGIPEALRQRFATAHEIPVEWHVRHQAVWQRFSESAVSKTINLPHAATVGDVDRAYRLAWDLGCLGITVFRDARRPPRCSTRGRRSRAAATASPPSGPPTRRSSSPRARRASMGPPTSSRRRSAPRT